MTRSATISTFNPEPPFAAARDLRALALWAFGYCSTAALPARATCGFLRAVARLDRGRIRRKAVRLAPRIAAVLASYSPAADFEAVARAYCDLKLEERVGPWWSLHGRRWPVALEVAGRHHLDAAIQAGRGAILWGFGFGGALAPKAALHWIGVPLVHLSGFTHGAPYPPTRLGLLALAPLQRRAERPYLDDRIVLGPSSPTPGLRRLTHHLRANRCVWMSGEGEVGRTTLPVRVLGIERRLATGAPSLALMTGAALLPTQVERLAPASYRLVFDPPISPPPGTDRSWMAEAVSLYASLLERAVLRHPADWDWGASWLRAAIADRLAPR